ncbi:MAG: CoA transferase [Alphaproteobacteria bacterium]|nr:CoA transferase [Alphaproteobacteria bacterium]
MDNQLPLAGLRVLDLTQGVAGPHCGLLLAQSGAQVIKVEPPEGDWGRALGTGYPGRQNVLSVVYNRGKRSLALDLRQPSGRDIVLRLARQSDIMLESNRPGVAQRLGIGFAQVAAINPAILYVSVSGFGQTGPYAERALTDTVAQAYTGLMSINLGADAIPHRVGMFVVDAVTGLYAFQAVQNALLGRLRHGGGTARHLDIPLAQSFSALLAPKSLEFHLEGGQPKAPNVPAGSFRTADGWIAVTLVRESEFPGIARAIGQPALADDPRFGSFQARAENATALFAILRQAIVQRGTDDWLARFQAEKTLCERIFDFGDWLADAHVKATEGWVSVEQPGLGPVPHARIPGLPPARGDEPRARAPRLGEQGREILAELGLSDGEIARLAADGIVRLPDNETARAAE